MTCENCKKLRKEITQLKERIFILEQPSVKITIEKIDSKEWRFTEKPIGGKPSVHIVPHYDVEQLRVYIFEFFESTDVVSARDLFREIIHRRGLKIGLDSFNGGKNRNKYYFPLYYRPVKILEHLGKIAYGKSGYVRHKSKSLKDYGM